MNTNAPRQPNINPETLNALNFVNTCVGQAPLTRDNHVQAANALQHIAQHIEKLEAAQAEASEGAKPSETIPFKG